MTSAIVTEAPDTPTARARPTWLDRRRTHSACARTVAALIAAVGLLAVTVQPASARPEDSTVTDGAASPTAAGSPGCPDRLGCIVVDRGQPVFIATLLALTGSFSGVGIDSQRGTELAVALRGGSVLGHPVRLMHSDGGCDSAAGARSAQRILSRPAVVATIGPTCSGVATGVAPSFSDRGLALIGPSTTNPALTDPATHEPTFLRTAYNDLGHGPRMADFVAFELGLATVASISDGLINDEFLARPFGEAIVSAGGTIVAEEVVPFGTTDFTDALQAVVSVQPDFLFFSVARPGDLVRQARATAGLASTALGTWTESAAADFLTDAGISAEGVYAVTPDFGFYDNPPFRFSNPDYQVAVAPAYRARWGDPAYAFHAHAYDATDMVLAAVEQVATEEHGRLIIGRQDLLDALYATTDHPGLTGRLACSANGDCSPNMFVINQVRDGGWRQISP